MCSALISIFAQESLFYPALGAPSHSTKQKHLAKHVRSHTREKPFTYRTCGKAFSRKQQGRNPSMNDWLPVIHAIQDGIPMKRPSSCLFYTFS